MRQHQIITAYRTLETLSDNEFLTETDQWNLYKLRKLLKPHFDFQAEREESIREKYQDNINSDGTIEGKPAELFLKDMQAIQNLDVELEEFTKPKIKMVKGITFKTIEPLEDFIEFLPPAE